MEATRKKIKYELEMPKVNSILPVKTQIINELNIQYLRNLHYFNQNKISQIVILRKVSLSQTKFQKVATRCASQKLHVVLISSN